ncbi:hypothetical protein [Bradyrhizobium sp. CCBAU 53351]|uniref:hypothetical protein n=1 Tax=Bradyrhizobium sp. CCBAU 53351 TaxID=1325114 RepID=UPI0018884D92|nr:hypothetical protein [Bradyrhizobium sp. CCBAU 53351]
MTKTWFTNAAIAVWISANSVLVLLNGMMGGKGHPAITAAVLIAPLVVIARKFRPIPADYLFAALAVLMVASAVVNGRIASGHEYALLAISMATILRSGPWVIVLIRGASLISRRRSSWWGPC